MEALTAIDEWPTDTAAAAVIDARGHVAGHGPTDQRFPLASITKLFTAVAALVAVEEGTLDLDEPAYDEGASLADLLAHGGGIAPDGTRLDLPGRRRVYSNAGYERIADALGAAADMTFSSYLHEAVFEPLEMSSTTLEGSPAHGATSTVDDLVRFLRGLDALLAAETISRMVTPHLPELVGVLPGYGRQAPNPWGLGPELRGVKSPHWTSPENSQTTWGHFGQAGTFVWTDPAARTSLVVLTDRRFGDWASERWPALSAAVLQSSRPASTASASA